MSTAPLNGIRVLALEQAIAAPLCSRKLAELGARVIKVERPETGDFARHYDSRIRGLSSHFVWVNRGKQSLAVNLKSIEGITIIQRLLNDTDVLLQNLAPGAAAKLGLGYADLRERYPRLIVCNISGYGPDGPYKERKAYDLLVQAEAGFLGVTGSKEQPAKSGISIADIAAGTQAHAAILAALLSRGQSDLGSEINVSMLEAMADWMGFPLNYAYDGASPPPRTGTDHASIFPYGAFDCADGKTLLIGLQNEREWQSFCSKVLESPELAADARFANNAARSSNREALRKLIEARFTQLDSELVAGKLLDAQIAFAEANDMQGLWQHPQLRARQRFVEFDSPAGPLEGLAPSPEHSDFSANVGDIPALGQHTKAVLQELGYSQEEQDALLANKAIGLAP